MLNHLKLAVGIALAAVVILFTLQNLDVVEVRFVVWKLELSRALMIFAILVAGILIGWFISGWFRIRSALYK